MGRASDHDAHQVTSHGKPMKLTFSLALSATTSRPHLTFCNQVTAFNTSFNVYTQCHYLFCINRLVQTRLNRSLSLVQCTIVYVPTFANLSHTLQNLGISPKLYPIRSHATEVFGVYRHISQHQVHCFQRCSQHFLDESSEPQQIDYLYKTIQNVRDK